MRILRNFGFRFLDDEITEEVFRINILIKYCKGKEGITESEFLNFFKQIYLTKEK